MNANTVNENNNHIFDLFFSQLIKQTRNLKSQDSRGENKTKPEIHVPEIDRR